MVKGVHHYVYAVMIFVIVVKLPQTAARERSIRKYVVNNNGLGSYSFEFETFDGTFRKEDGALVTNSNGLNSLTVRGEYGFIDPKGLRHTIRYVADVNGYRLQNSEDDNIRYNDRRII